MSPTSAKTIAERLRSKAAELTDAERKLMATLFANYPMAGLCSITDFARTAAVSTPTVLRLAKKLGFTGYPAFQEELRAELTAQLQNPISKHNKWSHAAPATHILNCFSQAVIDNLGGSLQLLDYRVFDRVVKLLCQSRYSITVAGGRITHALASYFATHLKMARPGVSLLPLTQTRWPEALLDMSKSDIIIIFDIRRYDAAMLDFAVSAKERGAKIVLITDQWMSPVAGIALHCLPLRIEVPSSWDSNVVPLFVVEALVAATVNAIWPATQGRIRALEGLTSKR